MHAQSIDVCVCIYVFLFVSLVGWLCCVVLCCVELCVCLLTLDQGHTQQLDQSPFSLDHLTFFLWTPWITPNFGRETRPDAVPDGSQRRRVTARTARTARRRLPTKAEATGWDGRVEGSGRVQFSQPGVRYRSRVSADLVRI